jgi:hypothetical protein
MLGFLLLVAAKHVLEELELGLGHSDQQEKSPQTR